MFVSEMILKYNNQVSDNLEMLDHEYCLRKTEISYLAYLIVQAGSRNLFSDRMRELFFFHFLSNCTIPCACCMQQVKLAIYRYFEGKEIR